MAKGFSDTFRKLVYAKIGLTSLIFAFYAGAKNHTTINRIEDSLLYKNVPVSEETFHDPAGLEVILEINKRGEKEAYIYHDESESKTLIGYDVHIYDRFPLTGRQQDH